MSEETYETLVDLTERPVDYVENIFKNLIAEIDEEKKRYDQTGDMEMVMRLSMAELYLTRAKGLIREGYTAWA